MRNLIIGGIGTVIVVAGSVILLGGQNQGNANDLEVLLQAYQELSEEVKDPKTKSNLSSNCQNTKAFTRQIEALEKKLKELKDKKNAMLNKKEYIPPLPEISPESIDTIKDDNISLPGSEVPELSSDVPPLPDIDIQVMEGNNDTPPRLGSEVPELSSDAPPLPDIDIQVMEGDNDRELLDKINAYEEEIRRELNNLKSLCDEEEKEIVSTSCESACKKYSECTHYTEDTTEQDRKDAYDSCMIECVNRSDKTKICINKKPIKTVMDCTHLSICALSEYSNVMDKTKRK